MSAIYERARAKINLTLRVLGRRADGYHLLESLIVFAGVGDVVTFEPGVAPAIEMSGPYAAAIAGSNLVDTALAALAAADPILTLGRVSVDKQLPIAAGIGGGSSDAAAVLRAVRRINPANGVDWDRLAAALGADVSVCLADRSSLVWGIGEHVEPVEGLPRLDAVLVCPQSAAPFGKTKSVFARLSVPKARAETPPAKLPSFPDAAALIAYMRGVGNDLRAPAHAVLPDSAEAEAALSAEAECLYVSLSGAGPTSYGIFPDAGSAAAAAERLRARHPHWWIAATTLGD
jgi:4-diphosphocytidyl-2-C-methyl-D-erythritol kinase